MKYYLITIEVDKLFDYEGLEQAIYEAVLSHGTDIIFQFFGQMLELTIPYKRVFSGVSAILDFEFINFREYDCSNEPKSPNCQIVELFLTVDTSRKLQNGVNIDESLNSCEFDFYIMYENFCSCNIFSWMDILNNDVIAILNEKINLKSEGKRQFSTFQPGPDK